MKRILGCVLAISILLSALPLQTKAAPTNTSHGTATQLTTQIGDEITVNGLSSGQSQWFKVSAAAGQWLYLAAYGFSTGTNDWDIGLYNSSNQQITYSAKAAGKTEYLGYTVPSTGTYYIKVLAFAVSSTTSSCKFKAVLSNGASGTSSTNNTYSRTTAKTYMTNHYATGTFNVNYPDFTGSGGDCTNFASQVVKAGGMGHIGNSSNRDAITSWFCTSSVMNTNNYSATWTLANKFTQHWGTNSLGSGNKRAYECKYILGQDLYDNFSTHISNIAVGDIIQMTNNADTSRYHSLIVYSKTSSAVTLAAHTNNTNNRSLKTDAQNNPTMMFVIIRIKSAA